MHIKILSESLEERKGILAKPRSKKQDNVKSKLESMDWIKMAQHQVLM
jgi:hypothetical protein